MCSIIPPVEYNTEPNDTLWNDTEHKYSWQNNTWYNNTL